MLHPNKKPAREAGRVILERLYLPLKKYFYMFRRKFQRIRGLFIELMREFFLRDAPYSRTFKEPGRWIFLGWSWHHMVKAPALLATKVTVLVSPALSTSLIP